jgi:lysophospholipase
VELVSLAGNDAPGGAAVHWLTGKGGVKVRFITAPSLGQPRGSVIVAPGRTEFVEKYFEVLRELQGRGFCVFSIDWRGQGLSDREVADPQKGYFKSFDDPVDDLVAALREAADALPAPHVLLAHSMGGGITLRALQKHKLEVAAAAFSSPMWGLKQLKGLAKAFAEFSTAIGAGGAFVPGVQRRWEREPFENNPVTCCPERHQRTQDLVAADERLELAGVTWGWLAAAAAIFDGFKKPGALSHLTMPILVASAGREMLVDNAAHDAIAALLPHCTHITLADSKHEILMEKDEVRAAFWTAFDALVDKAIPRGA